MFNPNKIIDVPSSNINEYQISQLKLLPLDSVNESLIITNEYIDKYYKNCNKVIKVNDLFDRYVKCIGVNQITSEEEFNFYKELDYIPLTKKYHYKLNSINSIDSISNYYNININIDVYNLLYNQYFKNNIQSNSYSINESYLNLLDLNSTINLNIIFDKNQFSSYDDCTANVFSNYFEDNLIGHLNCILFNDIITYNIINNVIDLNIISDITFENKFILNINNNDFYIEGDIDSLLYKLTTVENDTTINVIDLNISYIPLYKNIIYLKRYDTENLSIIFDMIILSNIIPVTSDLSEYNNLILGNDYLFRSFKYQNSAKLSQKKNFDTAKNYTQYLFNNIYQIETVESNGAGVVNVYSMIGNNPVIVKKYPFINIEEKFKIAAVLEHSSNIHNIIEYIDNENIFVTTDYTSIQVNEEDAQNYIDSDSMNISISKQHTLNNYDNNGDIEHAEFINDDYDSFHNITNITKTFGSYEGIKFAHSCNDSTNTDGDLLCYTMDGFKKGFDEERNFNGSNYCMNTGNISQSVITKLNNYSNEFTFIFMTNKYGFKNNYLKIGDFQKNVYGKIIILNKEFESINNMIYNIPVNDQDSTSSYDSILHILRYNNGDIKYNAYSDSTLFAELDLTSVDISNCNISTFNIFNHKKTINNTLYTDSSISLPTLADIKYYCNTVNLGTPSVGTKYEIDINSYRNNQSIPIEYGVYSDFPIEKYSNQDNYPFMVFELTIPSDCSNCKISYDKFQESQIQIYDGSFPDNMDLTDNFNGYFDYEDDSNYIYVLNKQNQTIYFIIKDRYYRELDIGSSFYIQIEYNDIAYSETKTLPVPYGKDKQITDVGLDKHKDKKEEFITAGKYHIYNQSLPDQRIDKIMQCYTNNKKYNTALFMD